MSKNVYNKRLRKSKGFQGFIGSFSDRFSSNLGLTFQLDKDFEREFKKNRRVYGKRFAELNGFSDEQLNYSNFIDNFIDKKTVADASIDGNANVGTKDICSLQSEMGKPHAKLMAFNKFYYEMKKMFDKETADEWLEAEWDGHYYMHDAYSSSWIPYCFAYDLKKLVDKGMFFIQQFNAQPAKHLTTFTDFVGEFVSWNSNRTSGACGLPSFLVYSFYYWNTDVNNGYYLQSPQYYRDQEFQRIIYKLNQPYLRVNQSAFTNFNIFDRAYLEALFGGKTYPDGSFIIDYIDDILEYQKAFMMVAQKIRSQNMMTFPVLTYSFLRKDGVWADEEYAKWCCRHNMRWADSNFFISDDINSLSNCCRLKSDIKNLGYFNSIGGSALEVGSIKVNTINLARIAYESKDLKIKYYLNKDTNSIEFKSTVNIDKYIETLKKYTLLCCKILDVVRHVITRNIEKGLLPNYSLEIINLKSQYNTIGIIGIYEALQAFGMTKKDEFGNTFYTDEGIDFAKKILATITDVKDEYAKDKDYSINIEEIPGERAAAVLMEKDKEMYPNEAYELPLYGNQWIPLAVKTTMKEKIRLSAILDQACSGGSISHINLDAPMENFDTAWNLLNYIADQGVTYFAFNLKISSCANNHGFYGDVCPICGGRKTTSWQRIVGFLTPESTYSKERKAEFAKRDWYDIDRYTDL